MSYFSISKNAIYAFLIAFICMFLASLVHAEGTDVAKKYGFSFPIAELGNCASVDECKTFCSDPNNQQACIDFARKHKFYKEKEAKQKQTDILAAASTELGCSTESECKEFCGQQQNWIKCGEFAKRHRLGLPSDGPQSGKAYENANQNAEFCRQYPEKCARASALPNRELCQNLKEKMPNATETEIKAFYLKNCAPPGYIPPSPKPFSSYTPYPKPSFNPEGNIGTTSSVKGISTVRNLLQTLLDWF